MFYFNQFETFDPVTGDVPEHPFSYLPQIACRARALLRLRTKEQIVIAANLISGKVESYFRDARDTEIYRLQSELDVDGDEFQAFFEWDGGTKDNGQWRFKGHMEDELDIPTANNTSELDALKTIIENRHSCFFLPEGAPPPEPEEFPEGKDFELFAVLSLWLLADALRFLNKTEVGLSIAGEYAIKAMDAVCYAEHLNEDDKTVSMLSAAFTHAFENQKTELETAAGKSAREAAAAAAAQAIELMKKETAEKRTSLARQLNEKKHAKRNQARALVCGEWDKNRSAFPSAEKAGGHYADWLELQGFEYEPRTVTNWIRDHAKKIGIRIR